MAKRRLRGVTLLEITIVMAVTAIMVTGIVSMCVSVNGISARSAQVSDVIGAVADCKKSLADWVSYFDKEGVTIVVGTDGSKPVLSAKNSAGEEVGSFKLDSDNHRIVADFGNGKLKTSNASIVFHISFDEYTQTTANGQIIIRCTLKYTLTQSSGKQLTTEQSFVVSTRRQTV